MGFYGTRSSMQRTGTWMGGSLPYSAERAGHGTLPVTVTLESGIRLASTRPACRGKLAGCLVAQNAAANIAGGPCSSTRRP
jgi:hypothetical protein